MKILVTGSAGFIGFHLFERLRRDGLSVTGLDNINSYYDGELKYGRLTESGFDRGRIVYGSALKSRRGFAADFVKCSLEDNETLERIFSGGGFDAVVHLAAQAGVRYSLENPRAYIDSNVSGFMNILECCRKYPVKHLVFASSSSVYGLNAKIPFSEQDRADHPVSLYAATKKANELMAHSYSHLYGVPATGLRFFTVYGPWGRPDMAYYKFTGAIMEGRSIDVYNNGNLKRDFTYIDDITEAMARLLPLAPAGNTSWDPADPDPSCSSAPYRIFNIGNNNPVGLMDFIETIERKTGIKAVKNFLPMQPGDVEVTYADIKGLEKAVGYRPVTGLEQGISSFVDWYLEYKGKSH